MELTAVTRFNSYSALHPKFVDAQRRRRKGGIRKDSSRSSVASTAGAAAARKSREQGAYNPWVERRVESVSLGRLLKTFFNGLVRGGMTGYSLRLAFKLIPLLVGTLRKNQWRQLPSRLRRLVINGVAEARFGLFVGALVGSLRSCLLMARYRGPRSSRWGALAGGALAGASLLLLPSVSHPSMMLFFFVRACEVLARRLAATGAIPRVEHADTLLMMAASAQVLWAWIFQQKSLDPSYVRFLNVHGGHGKELIHKLGRAQRGRENRLDWNEIRQYWAERGRKVVSMSSLNNRTCELRHPGQSCVVHISQFLYQGFLRAIKVYLPVHLLPLVIFGHKRLLSDPAGSAKHAVFSIARSSAFLTSYCSSAWLALCIQRQWFGIRASWVGFTCGAVGGSAVALEKKGRRVELALYVFSHALLSAWNVLRSRGVVPRLKLGAPALFGASIAVLLQAYMVAPSLLRPSYVSFVSWLLLWPRERKPRPLAEALANTSDEAPSSLTSPPPNTGADRVAFTSALPGSVRVRGSGRRLDVGTTRRNKRPGFAVPRRVSEGNEAEIVAGLMSGDDRGAGAGEVGAGSIGSGAGQAHGADGADGHDSL